MLILFLTNVQCCNDIPVLICFLVLSSGKVIVITYVKETIDELMLCLFIYANQFAPVTYASGFG